MADPNVKVDVKPHGLQWLGHIEVMITDQGNQQGMSQTTETVNERQDKMTNKGQMRN